MISGSVQDLNQIFQSPGPIYEPGMVKKDWWRSARALNAAGIGKGDIVQNCFSYHFTPAGMLSEQGILAVGATVFPAGTGQTELQARAASEIGVTAYIGVPDFLQIILELKFPINCMYVNAMWTTLSCGMVTPGIIAILSDYLN